MAKQKKKKQLYNESATFWEYNYFQIVIPMPVNQILPPIWHKMQHCTTRVNKPCSKMGKSKSTELHQFGQSKNMHEITGSETVPYFKLGSRITGYSQLTVSYWREYFLFISSEDSPGCGSWKRLWCHSRTLQRNCQVWGKYMTVLLEVYYWW